jgi:hypothetical protein
MRISPLTLVVVVACCGVASAWVPPSVPANSRSITSSSLIRRYVTLDGKEIRGPLTPLGNFCLVKTKDTLSSSEGGILIPDQVSLCINVSGKMYLCSAFNFFPSLTTISPQSSPWHVTYAHTTPRPKNVRPKVK